MVDTGCLGRAMQTHIPPIHASGAGLTLQLEQLGVRLPQLLRQGVCLQRELCGCGGLCVLDALQRLRGLQRGCMVEWGFTQ